MSPQSNSTDRQPGFRVSGWVRGLLCGVALALAWYIAARFRTTAPGFELGHLIGEGMFAFALAGPIAALAFLGARWTQMAAGVLLLTGAGIVGAEVWAGIEEHRFVVKHRHLASGPCARILFSDSWLSYDPVNGKLLGGD